MDNVRTAPKKVQKKLHKTHGGVNLKKESNSKLKIIPLGGLEQIGMNITAFEYEDSIIVVDCGLAFPEDDMLGIDLVIPDITYLRDNIKKVKGFVITHGHEDHIGSLPYVLKDMNLPIYATKLTMGIIENKLKEHNLLRSTRRKVVRHGQSINLGQFRIEFIRTNHSIQDAAALAIYSPAGTVVHTGDFKVDYTPVFGDAIDLQRFAEIGKKGVLAMMSDSTNAERPGFTMSERTVGKTFDQIFAEHRNTRIIIATFASNVDRVQQIINSAYKYDRKVVVEGRSMVNIISTASELGYLHIPDKTLIEIDQLKNYPDEKTVLITTGSQGESMAALSRMAADIHKKVTIKPGDTVIFSSNPIPGNEKAVSRVINELSQKGADVIFQDAHVSGHACQEELKLIYSLLKPKYAIPVHGEYRHLKANAKLAESLGIPKENIFIMHSGDVLALDEKEAKIVDKVHTGAILVDGLGVGDVGNIVLRDRQHLAEDGILIVVLTLEKRTNQLLAGPDIVSRGFVYVRESESLMEEARQVLQEALEKCLTNRNADWSRIKLVIRDTMNEFIWKRTKRKPMILPIIMDV
jgi:ribonuclease J